LRRSIRELEQQCRQRAESIAGAVVDEEPPPARCPVCGDSTRVQKTWKRTGVTLEHGSFSLRQTVRVCVSGCRRKKPAGALAGLVPAGKVIGYDVMVYVGLQRFLHNRQREEIRASLTNDYGISISSGEISLLCRRFLTYLERLHNASSPALKAALAADGAWPLHIDATGEDGRGTLFVAFTSWRQWVLGAWKIPTERADAILPRLKETIFRFGSPCAIVRDLGHAMAEAAESLLKQLKLKIPVLACHLHFLSDVGKDLMSEGHDRLRALFRKTKLRSRLRTLARELGRSLGQDIDHARAGLREWQNQTGQEQRMPTGMSGVATVRALAQWVLDYPADLQGHGFPFDLPWLALYDRCLQALAALRAYLSEPPKDKAVRKALERLQRILQAMEDGSLGFGVLADGLDRRAKLFAELRTALRLREESSRGRRGHTRRVDMDELKDIRRAVSRLVRSLRHRRPQRGPAADQREAIDIILSHLQKHGRSLWGHVILLPKRAGGGIRLVDRTNNAIESQFHTLKHGERRRSGRKVLTQDFEKLQPAAVLAMNLRRSDYVAIVCGSLEHLPKAFARLDSQRRPCAKSPISMIDRTNDPETASLSSADRKLVRAEEMTDKIIEAAQKGSRKRDVA
jgi:hypothetical protein